MIIQITLYGKTVQMSSSAAIARPPAALSAALTGSGDAAGNRSYCEPGNRARADVIAAGKFCKGRALRSASASLGLLRVGEFRGGRPICWPRFCARLQPSDSTYSNAFVVTGISGIFSDSNISILNAPIGMLEPRNFATPEPGKLLAPNSFSRFAVATGLPAINNGFLTYDNLFWPGGSPPTSHRLPDWWRVLRHLRAAVRYRWRPGRELLEQRRSRQRRRLRRSRRPFGDVARLRQRRRNGSGAWFAGPARGRHRPFRRHPPPRSTVTNIAQRSARSNGLAFRYP